MILELVTKLNNKLIGLFIIIFFSLTLMTSNSISLEMENNDIDNINEYDVSVNNNIIPPDPPYIEGPTNCNIRCEYNYNFTISHPYGHRLNSLVVMWGDGTNLTKNYRGSSCAKGWKSGYTLMIKHKWTKSGNFSIKAKVKDYPGTWSDWGILEEITVSKQNNQDIFNPWIGIIIERIPILRHLINY